METVPSPRGKLAPKPAESKPKYKTWELKVPLHCEGCKNDVKRILTKIKGVHAVHIEEQEKVTVVGEVDFPPLKEELKRKLRKHAELWKQKNQGVTSPAGSQPPVSKGEGRAEKSSGGSGGKKKEGEELKGNSTNNAVELQGRGSQEQPAQPCLEEGSSHFWYTPPVSFPSSTSPHSWYTPPVSFPSSTWSRSPSSSASSSVNYQWLTHQPESPSHVSPAEGAGLIPLLKDKSVDELQKLLSDEDALNQFLLSVDQVKTLKRDELCKEILRLQLSNLEKEAQLMELRKLCMTMWTTELAAAQEKLNALEKQKEDILKMFPQRSSSGFTCDKFGFQHGIYFSEKQKKEIFPKIFSFHVVDLR